MCEQLFGPGFCDPVGLDTPASPLQEEPLDLTASVIVLLGISVLSDSDLTVT